MVRITHIIPSNFGPQSRLTRDIHSVPLCYVYPAMLHYKACARTRKQKLADIVLMIFGLIAAAYTTIQTVRVRPLPQKSFYFDCVH